MIIVQGANAKGERRMCDRKKRKKQEKHESQRTLFSALCVYLKNSITLSLKEIEGWPIQCALFMLTWRASKIYILLLSLCLSRINVLLSSGSH